MPSPGRPAGVPVAAQLRRLVFPCPPLIAGRPRRRSRRDRRRQGSPGARPPGHAARAGNEASPGPRPPPSRSWTPPIGPMAGTVSNQHGVKRPLAGSGQAVGRQLWARPHAGVKARLPAIRDSWGRRRGLGQRQADDLQERAAIPVSHRPTHRTVFRPNQRSQGSFRSRYSSIVIADMSSAKSVCISAGASVDSAWRAAASDAK